MKRKEPEGLVSVGEAESQYGISRSTIYRLARRGELTVFRRVGDRKSYVERQRVEELAQFRPKTFKSK